MDTKPIADLLNRLIAVLKDGQEGFQLAAADSRTPGIKAVCAELSAQRAAFANQLQGLVAGLGREYETSVTVSGALHRGWLNLKASLTRQDDHDVLVECERGEDGTLQAYREALESRDLSELVASVLRAQAIDLQAAHDRIRVLRDSLAVA